MTTSEPSAEHAGIPCGFRMARWLKTLPLNPLSCRLQLLDAIEQQQLLFPNGLSSGSLLPLVVKGMFLDGPDHPERHLLQERYAALADLPSAGAGFPLEGILELLDRMTQGEHPLFNSAAVKALSDRPLWDDPENITDWATPENL
jgi:hypothetical protein